MSGDGGSRNRFIKPHVVRQRDRHGSCWHAYCPACEMEHWAWRFDVVQYWCGNHRSKATQTLSGHWRERLPCTPDTRAQRAIERQVSLWRAVLLRLADS